MGLSETILAAAIGAAATISTAMFQLFSVLRSNNKLDSRPKRGNTLRSIVAVFALMVASGVGGFMFSELRQERTAQDMHSMREELNEKLQVLAATTEKLAASREVAQPSAVVAVQAVSTPAGVESVVYAPACAQGSNCTEETGVSYALCGTIPTETSVKDLDLFATRADAAEPSSEAQFEQDLGGAKFTGAAAEYAQAGRKAVCVNFKHWSDRAHVARLVVHFGSAQLLPEASAPLPATNPITAHSSQPSMVATGAAPVIAAQNASLDTSLH